MGDVKKQQGSCHCKAVRFEVELDPSAGGTRCNCTICAKIGQLGSIVKPAAFTLLEGETALTSYPNSVGKRMFCKTCGVHVYGDGHLKEVGGDFVSVNLNTLDGVELADIPTKHWDGRHDNWQAGPRDTPWPMYATPAA